MKLVEYEGKPDIEIELVTSNDWKINENESGQDNANKAKRTSKNGSPMKLKGEELNK